MCPTASSPSCPGIISIPIMPVTRPWAKQSTSRSSPRIIIKASIGPEPRPSLTLPHCGGGSGRGHRGARRFHPGVPIRSHRITIQPLFKCTGVMRPGQTSRPYGRNNGNNSYRNRQQIPNRSQTFDSNGPNVKIRGTPHQIFERYVALAREASTSGDRVAAENLYQHAEHYFRIMNAANEGHQHRVTRPGAPADVETEMAAEERSESAGRVRASPSDRQPYSA